MWIGNSRKIHDVILVAVVKRNSVSQTYSWYPSSKVGGAHCNLRRRSDKYWVPYVWVWPLWTPRYVCICQGNSDPDFIELVNSVVVRSPASLAMYLHTLHLNLYQLFGIPTVKCFAMEVIDADPARSTAQHCGRWGAKQHRPNSIVSNILFMTATQTICRRWNDSEAAERAESQEELPEKSWPVEG